MSPYDRLVTRPFGTHRGLVRYWLAEVEYSLGRVNAYASPDLSAVRRVVYTCLGNLCRSAFAEAASRAHGLPAVSLGLSTTTGASAAPEAQGAAARRGIDLSGHRATDWRDFAVHPGDLLLAMEIRHARRLSDLTRGMDVQIALLGQWAHPRRVHIHDPLTLTPAYFDTCFAVLDSAVQRLASELPLCVQARGRRSATDDGKH